MTWTVDSVTDGIGMVLILFGAMLCLTAAIGLLRFRDLLTRMHAATKPQVLGVLLVLLGVALSKESGLHIGMLLLVGIFQMLTIPVGAHMVGRAGFRTGQVAPSDVHLGPPADHVTDAEAADEARAAEEDVAGAAPDQDVPDQDVADQAVSDGTGSEGAGSDVAEDSDDDPRADSTR